MAAYAAVISLKNTIEDILVSPRIWLDYKSLEIIQLVYEKLTPLQDTLERLDGTRFNKSRTKINALDGRIKDAIRRFEDLLEHHLTDHILSQLREEEEEEVLFDIDLQGLQPDADSFIRRVECLEEEYIYELENLPDDDDDDDEEEERIGFGGKKSKMIGSYKIFEDVRDSLIRRRGNNTITILHGMAGIGKTTIAEEIFEDPRIQSHFDPRVWVTVGRRSRSSEYCAHAVVVQLDPNYDDKGDGKDVGEYLKERLEGQICLIVLDDVWEREVIDLVISSIPENRSGSIQILVTARDRNVVKGVHGILASTAVPFMNDEDSKDLFCQMVFGERSLPLKLEKAAMKIANKCEGLPLLIVTVANQLLQGDMTEEYLNEVAEERNSIFMEAYNEISKVLFPSYEYLPQYLKILFLYLGVFSPDCDITPSKLLNMLVCEGWFLDDSRILRPLWKSLKKLCQKMNLVKYNKRSISWCNPFEKSYQAVKNCRLHSSWRRYLCQVEAPKNKFFHVLNRFVDCAEEVIQGHRCLSLHNNILFGIKDVFDVVKSNSASSMRSLLFFGPYQKYPVPIDVGFKLLRELNALKLRFYTFPNEILELVRLQYLALTCNGELPSTISKLFNLRVLIVHQHTSIRSCGAPLDIPIQIWDMQELIHIEILGRDLPSPHHVASLEKLSTLIGVNASTCTILGLFNKIPNIIILGVQIDVMNDDDDDEGNLLNCFNHISRLEKLMTLKCSIVNPLMNGEFVGHPSPGLLKFPLGLRKLHLSGMGFPWEYMDAIGSLPYLQVLKLRSYAFRGPKWNVKGQCFRSLEFLLIEDSDLVQWTPGFGSIPNLAYVIFKHCYELQMLYWLPAEYKIGKIELVDCNPLAVTYIKQIHCPRLHVTVTSSF